MPEIENIKFIADENAGGLVKLLRLLGFDTTFFHDGNDSRMVELALAEKRIILTRDTHIPERRLVASHQVNLVLIDSDNKLEQLQQVEKEFGLKNKMHPFTLCLECNRSLQPVNLEQIQDRIPPYVFRTQTEFLECPQCRRVYWKGTHWQAMNKKLKSLNIFKSGEDK
jgi:uncharacterized protein